MSYWRLFGPTIFAALCLLCETAGSAHAQCSLPETSCATEWSGGKIISLGGVPGFVGSGAIGINDAGQVVGASLDGYGRDHATEWSGGRIINLGILLGAKFSEAVGINDAGEAVGFSGNDVPAPAPESSTWAMMLLGFAGLGLVGYRSAAAASRER
jgi:probable HAF family extracellular repeat protein